MAVWGQTWGSCFTSRNVWGSLLNSLKNRKKGPKIDFLGSKDGGGGDDFWTIFGGFFSESKSDPQTFLEVKQDPQAGL